MTEPAAPPADPEAPEADAEAPTTDETTAPSRDEFAPPFESAGPPIAVHYPSALSSARPRQVAYMAGQMWRNFRRDNSLPMQVVKALGVAALVLVVLNVGPIVGPGWLVTTGVIAGPYLAIARERHEQRRGEAEYAAAHHEPEPEARETSLGDDVLPDMGPSVDGPDTAAPDAPAPSLDHEVVDAEIVDEPFTSRPAPTPEPDIVDAEVISETVTPVPTASSTAPVPVLALDRGPAALEAGPARETASPEASAPEAAAATDDVRVAIPMPGAAPAPEAADLKRFQGRMLNPEELHAARSDLAKTVFWNGQAEQATVYRDAFEAIAAADSPKAARAIATEALDHRSSDAVRCRENLAYRSAFEQIAEMKSAGAMGRIKSFASEVLGIYSPDVSVATTRSAPTAEHSATVAAHAAEFGTVAATVKPVSRTVADAARAARTAGPEAAVGL